MCPYREKTSHEKPSLYNAKCDRTEYILTSVLENGLERLIGMIRPLTKGGWLTIRLKKAIFGKISPKISYVRKNKVTCSTTVITTTMLTEGAKVSGGFQPGLLMVVVKRNSIHWISKTKTWNPRIRSVFYILREEKYTSITRNTVIAREHVGCIGGR